MLTCFLSGSVGERRGGVTTVAEVILGLTPFTHTHTDTNTYMIMDTNTHLLVIYSLNPRLSPLTPH